MVAPNNSLVSAEPHLASGSLFCGGHASASSSGVTWDPCWGLGHVGPRCLSASTEAGRWLCSCCCWPPLGGRVLSLGSQVARSGQSVSKLTTEQASVILILGFGPMFLQRKLRIRNDDATRRSKSVSRARWAWSRVAGRGVWGGEGADSLRPWWAGLSAEKDVALAASAYGSTPLVLWAWPLTRLGNQPGEVGGWPCLVEAWVTPVPCARPHPQRRSHPDGPSLSLGQDCMWGGAEGPQPVCTPCHELQPVVDLW